MTRYERAGDEVVVLVMERMEAWEPNLYEAGVSLDVLMAYAKRNEAGEVERPAILRNGHQVLGMVRIMRAKDRAAGRADAELVLDGDHWGEISAEEREALVDHELHHLQPVTEKDGHGHKVDDLGRPKLSIRHHDFEFGGFHVIAQRHGEAAAEVQAVREGLGEHAQLYLPGFVPA